MVADLTPPSGDWPTSSDELIDALRHRGVDRQLGWYGGLQRSNNRLGEVDVGVVLGHGQLNLLLDEAGHGVQVLVWHEDHLTVWGLVEDLDALAATVRAWAAESDAPAICQAWPGLRYDDGLAGADAIAEQWRFLLRDGYRELMSLAEPVSRHPILRRLRPWVSHGTLYLVEGNARPPARHSLAFHPQGDERWRVASAASDPLSPPLTVNDAVTHAAVVASAWQPSE